MAGGPESTEFTTYLPAPAPEYVTLIRAEAQVAGIELPADNMAAVRFVLRAAVEAQ